MRCEVELGELVFDYVKLVSESLAISVDLLSKPSRENLGFLLQTLGQQVYLPKDVQVNISPLV